MILVPVAKEKRAVQVLYDLLKERTPEQSISHARMPTMEEHAAFVRSSPYAAWYLIEVLPISYEAAVFGRQKPTCVGATYLTKQREVGIFIFRAHQGKGYAREAIALLREKHPGRLLANVNPDNEASNLLFKRMGGKVIQVTYAL